MVSPSTSLWTGLSNHERGFKKSNVLFDEFVRQYTSGGPPRLSCLGLVGAALNVVVNGGVFSQMF